MPQRVQGGARRGRGQRPSKFSSESDFFVSNNLFYRQPACTGFSISGTIDKQKLLKTSFECEKTARIIFHNWDIVAQKILIVIIIYCENSTELIFHINMADPVQNIYTGCIRPKFASCAEDISL